MNKIKGDLIQLTLEGRFDVIVHGCNCFCNMEEGIAKLIKENFPQAYEADLKTIKGDISKLGTYSMAKIKRNNHIFTIINGYSQYNFKGKGILADYIAIKKSSKKLKKISQPLELVTPKLEQVLQKVTGK